MESKEENFFSTDLFSFNDEKPFAAYMEPTGWAEQAAMKRPTIKTYTRLLPQTVKMAKRMLKLTLEPRRWGRQLPSWGWMTETEGDDVPCRRLPSGETQTRKGLPLRDQDIIKHLTGRTHAVGTLDAPRAVWRFDEEYNAHQDYHKVNVLRIDVDQDNAWRYGIANFVIPELTEQRAVAHDLGLPYHVFRTGGRGVQAVIPLPCKCSHRIASLLLGAYLELLESRKSKYTKLDVDNLHSLCRLPGGLHARTGRLGLWIDIDNECLYPLETQITMMTQGFRYPKEANEKFWEPQAFMDVNTAISELLDSQDIPWQAILTPTQLDLVLNALPNNPLIQKIISARESIEQRAIERKSIKPISEEEQNTSDNQHIEELKESPDTEEPPIVVAENLNLPDSSKEASSRTFHYTMEWASQVWEKGYKPGGHWEWLNMSGGKGILAATILFGKDNAEQELLKKAHDTPFTTYSDLQERIYTVKNAWRHFRMKDFTAYNSYQAESRELILGETSEDILTMTYSIVDEMVHRQPKYRWNREVAVHLVEILLVALHESESGIIDVSYRTLSDSINARFPDSTTNHMRIKEMILRLIPGDKSIFKLLTRISGRTAKGEPDWYSSGEELLNTGFGQVCEEKRFLYMDSLFSDDETEYYLSNAFIQHMRKPGGTSRY